MIFIDASRYNITEQRTGVENYSFHLINHLAQAHPNEITLITPQKIDLPVKQIVIPFPRLWTHIRLSWEIFKNKKIDNLFVPSHVLPLLRPKKTAIMIHDVAFRRFPESYGFFSRMYLEWSTRFAVKHATVLLTPSEATKKDLIDFYAADPEKIAVIPHGHAVSPVEAIHELSLQKYGIAPKKYFLYVGRIETKKNLGILIEAFNRVQKDHPDYKLVLAGKGGVGAEAIRKQAATNPNIIFTGYIDESAKATLLKNALAFVFPSLYEGFGFPLLEAMEYGLPIIASDIPASREVADGAADFFNPNDASELETKLGGLIGPLDKGGGRGPGDLAGQILAAHTWPKCAEATWNAIEKIIDTTQKNVI